MRPITHRFLSSLQQSTEDTYEDDCEINPMVEVPDGFGNSVEKYPHSGYVVKGSLQEVQRVPGTPEGGSTTLVTGNYLIKLPWDAKIEFNDQESQKGQIVVNGVGVYQVMNVYGDRHRRLSKSAYCYKVM
jgi:hypothetical protein